MIKRMIFWLECSRWYAIPMTVFSWFIVFSYALQNDGNALYGFIALLGICLAHLGTNLFDDFCDYHFLKKNIDIYNNIVLPNTQRGKCRYLIEHKATLKEVLTTVFIYAFLALLTGIFFYFTVGSTVLKYVIAGSVIVLLYPLLSNIRMSEVAVATAFGPLLFGGTYYVMTGHNSWEVMLLSIPSTIFTVNLLYTDTFLDKDIDKSEGKNTIVGLLSDNQVFRLQKILLTIGYLSVLLIPAFDIADWEVFFTFLTIPLAFDLLSSLKLYSEDKTIIPEKKWYHFPFEAWKDIEQNRSQTFMFRMYQARNLMIYFSLILGIMLWFN